MKMRSGEKIRLASVEELLGVPDDQNATEIEIANIRPFPNHPFQVRDDEQMDDLVDSIKVNGVITPVLVRDCGDGFQMISGHRRMHAAVRAGLSTIPAVIREMTDDESIVYMVDSNIQREELLPSEKAFAIKMKLDAMKRKAGRPSKSNLSQNGTHFRSDQELAEQIGSSRNQVQRYVRLTMLIPELLTMVDEKKLTFTLGVEISYLGKQIQEWIRDYIIANGSIKPFQIDKLRKAEQIDQMSHDEVLDLLSLEKSGRNTKRKKLTIPYKEIAKYFDADSDEDKMLETSSPGSQCN